MSSLIDWELLAQLQSSPQIPKAEPWNAFAKRYDGYSRLQRLHTRAQIDYMRLQAGETLLDVGAGTGRISVPAAQQVTEVTALDVAEGMLALLSKRAVEEGVHNIRTLQLDWADVQPGINVPLHDVVIASRSPATIDLHKLDAMATRAVYIMLFHGPSLKQFHDTLVAGIDHLPSIGPQRSAIQAQALLFNRLVEMGIDARVDYLEDGFYAQFASEDEAVAHFDWLDLPAGSQDRLRTNLRPFLHPCEGGVELLARTCSAVIWWDKSPITMDNFGAYV